jgi:hypothetical protein
MVITMLYQAGSLQPRESAVHLVEAAPAEVISLYGDFPELLASKATRSKFGEKFTDESDVFVQNRDQRSVIWIGKPLTSLIRELDIAASKALEEPSRSKLVRDFSYRCPDL